MQKKKVQKKKKNRMEKKEFCNCNELHLFLIFIRWKKKVEMRRRKKMGNCEQKCLPTLSLDMTYPISPYSHVQIRDGFFFLKKSLTRVKWSYLLKHIIIRCKNAIESD